MVRVSMLVGVGVGVVGVAAGCGPAPKRPLAPERDAPEHAASVSTGDPLASSPGLPAPPAGFATSDLVMMTGGELSAWAIVDGKLVKTGGATIATVGADSFETAALTGIGQGEWADRDHLFVTVGEREVVMITPRAITRVDMPAAAVFDAPKPPDPQGDLTPGGDSVFGADAGLVVSDGAATWSRCAWGLPYDGFQCELWVHVQLWPTRERHESPQSRAARRWAWPAAPAGYTAKTSDKAVTCSGPKVTTQIPAGTGGGEDDESIESVQWVSAEPPRLLVSYGHMGYADLVAERWTLHEGCIVPPLATGSTAMPGPAGLWIGASDGRPPVLYRGARIIGELPEHAAVMLRPPR